jgi:hypothetical protein
MESKFCETKKRGILEVPLASPILIWLTNISDIGTIMMQKLPMCYVLQQTYSIVFSMA